MGRHEFRNLVEWHRTQHHVVFVRAPACAFTVDIIAMQYDCGAGLFAGFARTGAHDAVSGMIIEHGIKRIISFGRRVLRMRMIHIHTSAISCDHVGDVELRRVGK